jgi:hypothetical protein
VIERPIVILSAPRAGSTLLFETLAQAEGLYTIGGESHQLIESIAALRPGRGVVSSNRLTRRDATTAIVTELRRRFTGRVQNRDQQPPASGAQVRLLEKTPKNALRVPFLLEVIPGRAIHLPDREPRANLSSMMEAWRGKGWVTYRQLPGWPGPWSLLLPPGYERLQGRPLEEVVAFQWRVANETILDDLGALPRERWTSLRYEDLVAEPRAAISKLLKFRRARNGPAARSVSVESAAPSRLHADEAGTGQVEEKRGGDREGNTVGRGGQREARVLADNARTSITNTCVDIP